MSYATGTNVPVAKSRSDIEHLLTKAGAAEYSSGWMNGTAAIQFAAKGRRVRFTLPMPTGADGGVAWQKLRRRAGNRNTWVTAWVDQESRRRWRCLLLAIKAKLEVVETGIETFEQAFFANLVTEEGATLYELLQRGSGPKLLEAPR